MIWRVSPTQKHATDQALNKDQRLSQSHMQATGIVTSSAKSTRMVASGTFAATKASIIRQNSPGPRFTYWPDDMKVFHSGLPSTTVSIDFYILTTTYDTE